MKKSVIAIILSLFVAYSCNPDDFTGLSSLVASDPGIVTPAAVFATEGSSATLKVMVTAPQIVDMDIDFEVDAAASTAVEGLDFTVDTESPIRVAAHRGFFEIEFTIIDDFPADDGETIVVNLGPSASENFAGSTETGTINIADGPMGNDIEMRLGWDGTYDVEVAVSGTAEYGGPFDLITGEDIVDGAQQLAGCAFADFDFYVVDDEFASFYTSAASSDCPEVMAFPAEGIITNGTATTDTFFIFSDLYLNWGSSEFANAAFPLVVDAVFHKKNTLTGTWTQDALFAYPSDLEGGLGTQANWVPMIMVIRDEGTWTIFEGANEIFNARFEEMGELQQATLGSPLLPKSYEN